MIASKYAKFVMAGIVSAFSFGIVVQDALAENYRQVKERKECEVLVNDGVAGGLCGRMKMSVRSSPVDEYKKCIAFISTTWPECAPHLKGEVVEDEVLGVNGKPRKVVHLKPLELW